MNVERDVVVVNVKIRPSSLMDLENGPERRKRRRSNKVHHNDIVDTHLCVHKDVIVTLAFLCALHFP